MNNLSWFPMRLLVLSLVSLGAVAERGAADDWTERQIEKLPDTEKPVRLFNGKDFSGWEGQTEKFFSVQENSIVAKNSENNAPAASSYLVTQKKYRHFRLIFESKLVTSEMHSGIAFWGKTVEKQNDPYSYMGHLVMFPSNYGYHDLYRRNSIYRDKQGIAKKAGKQHGWNRMEILAIGNRIRHVVNGRLVADWSDPKPDLCQDGPIGLQLHKNRVPQEIVFRGLILTENPEDRLVTVSKSEASTFVSKPYVYKRVGERALRLHVTTPEDWSSEDSRAAIVFFHGGGWVGGRPGQFTEHSKYLASRGMVAVQVEYRLLDRQAQDPPTVCVFDARSAMRWVRSHADELGINPRFIASAGGSAGGHLAAFVGMVDGMDDPQDDQAVSAKSNAMVLFNPVFDNGPQGWGHQRVGDRYREFSPVHNVSGDDPPVIVFLGSADKLIPVQTAMDYKSAMVQAGIYCEVRLFEGQPHGFFNHGRNGNRAYFETVTAMDHFLTRLNWLSGPPTLKKP